MLPIAGAAALLGGGGLSGGTATATQGPSAAGPVVINVAGFGSKASGSASASASGEPQATGGLFADDAGGGLPSWVIPAAVGLVLVIVLASVRK